jgi:hypothetical protein
MNDETRKEIADAFSKIAILIAKHLGEKPTKDNMFYTTKTKEDLK